MRWAIVQIPSMVHRCPSEKVAIAIDGIEWSLSTGTALVATALQRTKSIQV